MTVTSAVPRASYTGNGSTKAFSAPFYFLADADLLVIETIISTGAQTVKALTTDYTVTGALSAGGGTVSAVSAPASSVTWTILRDPSRDQLVDIVDNDPLPAASIETPLDKLTMLVQRQYDIITRSLRQPDGDTSSIAALPAKVTRAGMYLTFDASGNPEAINSVVAVSAVTANSANINTVAAISANVTSVAGISANVTSVAGISANIASVLGISANIATVAGISANVTSVAGISANVTSVAGISAAITSVNAISASILAVSAGGYLQAAVTATLTAGYTATAYNNGTVSAGTLTVTPSGGNLQRYVNNGAHTLAMHSAGDYTVLLQMTNSASAGALTTSSFTKVTGDALTTTNGDDFLLYLAKVNGFMHLHKQAMQ